MLMDVLLALGLLVSSASQMRPAGEICLALWLFPILAQEVGRLGPPLTPVLSRLLTFWIIFVLAMCFGTMTGFALGDVHDPVWFLHDTMAYVLVAAVSCLSVVEPGAWSRMHRVAWLVTTVGAVWLALQVAHGWRLIGIGDIDPWEWDRLRGLCESSNQLALVCLVIGFLSLHLLETASRFQQKFAALICLSVAIFVGRLTKSDAFLLALLAAGPILVALKLRTWMLERTLTLASALAWILVLVLPAILAYVIPLGTSIAAQAEHVAGEMTRGTSRHTEEAARLRLELWKEAIRRGTESAMLGLGPGPHIEIPNSILAGRRHSNDPKNVDHPKLTYAPNFEAHNTALDLFTQGGLLAVCSFLWLLVRTFLMTCRSRLDALTTLLCGFAIFSIFHLIVRHPIAWFAITFCLVMATHGRSASMTPVRS